MAQALLGKLLVHETTKGVTAGYIVETEAYLGAEDQASHSFQRKRSPKNESMYRQSLGRFICIECTVIRC